METINYERFRESCTEFRNAFADRYFSAGGLYCHPLLDGVIYTPCTPEEAKSNRADICRMSDMLLMSEDGKEYVPFKIAEARKIAQENGSVYIANLLCEEAFMALDWMIDGKHDTLIISEEHMKKEGKPYAPVTPLTNVIQPFKKFTNHFLYKKGTLEAPAVLSENTAFEKPDSFSEETLSEFPKLEIAGNAEFELFGAKMQTDKNEARCMELDKGLELTNRLIETMKPNIDAFKNAGVDFDLNTYIADFMVKAAEKCGVKAEKGDFPNADDMPALKDAFRKLISEKNGYGFKYVPADEAGFKAALKDAELSEAPQEELKKEISALLCRRPACPAALNMARAVSPTDAENVENISEYWGVKAYSPMELSEYLDRSYAGDSRDGDGKLICGGIKATLILEDIKTAAAKYKIKNVPVIDELARSCEEYDRQSRTYNGTVFETAAEMEKAVKNEKELAELCGDLTALSEAELIKLRKYIYDMQLDRKTTGRYLLKIKLALNDCQLNQMKILCTGLTLKKPEELAELKKKISGEEFDQVVAAPFIEQIDDAVLKVQLEELRGMFKDIPDSAAADRLEKELDRFDKVFKRHFSRRIASARDGFAVKELEKIAAMLGSADNKGVDGIISAIEAVKCRASLKQSYLKAAQARKDDIERIEADGVFAAVKTADKAKLAELRQVIASGKFRKIFTDKYEAQIQSRQAELDNAEFIAKCETIPQMNKAALDEITAVLESEKYPEEITSKYLAMAAQREKAIIKEELALICKDISSMDNAKLDETENKLKDEKYPEELTAQYFDAVKARRKAILNAEVDRMCDKIGMMGISQLRQLEKMLSDEKYDPEYTKKYFDQINKSIDSKENQKLADMCRDIGKLKKTELEKLAGDIEALGYKKENTDPYMEKIRNAEIALMRSELESLCKNIPTTPRKELVKLKEALSDGGFDKELAAKYIEQIDRRCAELIKQELEEMCRSIPSAPKEKLISLKLSISEVPEYAEQGKAYIEQIDSRLKAIDKAEFDKQMASIEKLNAEELDRFLEELEKRKPALDVKLYEASLSKCRERGNFLEREKLDKLCAEVSGASLEKLHEIKEKISEGDFTAEITYPYIKKVDKEIEDRYVQHFSKLMANMASMSRAELIVLLEKINENDVHCPDDMLQRYIGKVNSKIREADSKLLGEKCANLSSAGEHKCFELIKDINEMDIDADTKKRFIGQVELHITDIKTKERDGYVEQLKNIMAQNSITGVHFYVPGMSAPFEGQYVKIQSTYASTQQFEMPVLIHESTPGHAEDSYLLTVSFLYFQGKNGFGHIALDQIDKFAVKKGLLGATAIQVFEKNGKVSDLPNGMDKKSLENASKVLNGILGIIQKDKAAAKLREAEEIKAAEEEKIKQLEEERAAIEEARKKAKEAENAQAAAPAAPAAPIPAAEKKEPVPEKKPEPVKPIKPIEVVVSPIPEVKPIKHINEEKPAAVNNPPAVKPAAPVPAKPAETAVKPAAPIPPKPGAAPVSATVQPPVKPIAPIGTNPADTAAKPVQPPVKPAAPIAAKPAEPPIKPIAPVTAKPAEAVKPIPAATAKPVQPAENAPKVRFCDQCGAKIQSDTAKFCMECGNRLIK
ncbi:MAG: zinc-ribbon domain-containing protein [Ruminococcus sp.]|nr:zinc-ribbon domain-containing protein [Ruminococcus sp.]